MGKILTNLSFEDWVRYLFDHPVTEPEWYWDEEADSAELEPQLVIDYATRLFQQSGELLSQYTDAQANQGLWFLISECNSPLYALTDPAIPLMKRVQCIRSMTKVFELCFANRCTPHLSHLDESNTGALNLVCYMWWDILPSYVEPQDAARHELDQAYLSVMEATLQLPSVACQESALHGLAHWGFSYENACRNIISAFIKSHANLRPELLAYATLARERNVL